jgi:hypothetical protein
MSASTLGGVKYTSKREAETKASLEEAKLAKAERKALKRATLPTAPAQQVPVATRIDEVTSRMAASAARNQERLEDMRAGREARKDAQQVKFGEHVQSCLDGTYPKWRLTTSERAMFREALEEQHDGTA